MGAILLAAPVSPAAADRPPTAREDFARAWQAASKGNRTLFQQLMPQLTGYLLYPYLQYEDYRHRRAGVDEQEMAAFLDRHEDWAFSPALKTVWLRTQGKLGRWDVLLRNAAGSDDTEVRCYLARARIQSGESDGPMQSAQTLWTVGKSQPDACDPVFSWLQKNGGISSSLAWERIRRAMEERQTGLVRYLARFVDEGEQQWVDRWLQEDRSSYRRLDRATAWPDGEKQRDISHYGLRRLSRSDADRAAVILNALEGHFSWPPEDRAALLYELALWSAVDGSDETSSRMEAVPRDYRDDRLLEWWTRHELSRGNWTGVVDRIEDMSPAAARQSRWRYWSARAKLEAGPNVAAREAASEAFGELALEANYYGFLAADQLGLPYTICPEEPAVEPSAVDALRRSPGFDRALELRAAGVRNWARSEWMLATRKLDNDGLRKAAALAHESDWPDMTIFALGNSGDLRWYEWRFPLEHSALVESYAVESSLDPSWVLGLMRSESAMAVDAVSPAGALGLMQVMPQTARQLARRHAIPYQGRQQLTEPEKNIRLGTTYLRELLDRFDQNPTLASGAYNAGPHAVERWLTGRRSDDPAVWIETLPYFETRDYIPRVMAFATIYDWRLRQQANRLSSRMPAFDSGGTGGTMQGSETTEVVCRTPG